MNHGCRKCRRETTKLFLKGERCFSPKCAVTTRPFPPGQHGPSSYTKLSEYGKQLREKQKVKKVYGINETSLRNYYTKASNKPGDTSENLVQLLESRLDSIIYRLGVAPSKSTARQMVSHRFFRVNKRIVNIPSHIITSASEISPNENKKVIFGDKVNLPSWISFDAKTKIIKLKNLPNKDEIELPFDINLVIEYYSR
ncbi:MAG: 30S ribosomal protein S4 [Candidatus Berkelbacteria bacterium]|nr:30S ribosomal protein S4 [Candidatus Berkelbacteria bacterium]